MGKHVPLPIADSVFIRYIFCMRIEDSGFDLNRAARAEQQADEGLYMVAAEYFETLRIRIRVLFPD